MKRFTLLELILVTFILALIASSALLVVDNFGDQDRYDGNKILMEAIRTSIIGNENKQGFIKDVGRLPIQLDEVFNNNLNVREWSYDPVLGYKYGWRGPYIDQLDQEMYRDAWGFFWKGQRTSGEFVTTFTYNLDEITGEVVIQEAFDPGEYVGAGQAESLTILSTGKDGSFDVGANTDPYDDDKTILVNNFDVYQPVDTTFSLKVRNLTSSTITENVKLLILFPHDDLPSAFTETWSDTEMIPFLSESAQPLTVDAGQTEDLVTVFKQDISYWKARVFLIDDDATGTIEDKIIGSTDLIHHIDLLENDGTIELEYKITE